jgi:hypothetical protein
MKRPITILSAALLMLMLALPAIAQMTPGEVGKFNEFLNKHPKIAGALARNPGLADNPTFITNHPELHQYLENHPGVREQLKAHPGQFMAHEGGGYEWNAGPAEFRHPANYDEYMEHHPEVWQEVAGNPALVQNHEWMEKHPEFQEYLAHHPNALQKFKEHPHAYQGKGRQFGNEQGH